MGTTCYGSCFKVFLFEDLPPADRRADDVYFVHYIERAGAGTLNMIRLCREAGLPEPEFRHEGERFVVVIWRDWLTDAVMAGQGLNERQIPQTASAEFAAAF